MTTASPTSSLPDHDHPGHGRATAGDGQMSSGPNTPDRGSPDRAAQDRYRRVSALVRRSRGRLSRLILLSIVALFVLFGTGIWIALIWASHERTLNDARAEARLLSHVVDEHFQWTIKGSDLVLRQAADMAADSGLEAMTTTEANRRKLLDMARTLPQIGALWFIDAQGRAVYSTARGKMPPVDFSNTDYFQAHLNGQALYITPATQGTISDIVFFSISRRIEKDGQFLGVVLASIDMAYFARFHKGLGVPSTTALELFRTDGRLVVRWPINEDMVGRNFLYTPFFHDVLSTPRQSDDIEAPAIVDGKPSLLAYRRLPDLPLVAIATIDREAVLASWKNDAAVGLVFAVLGYGVIAALTFFALRTFARETQAQQTLAERTVELEEALEARTLLFKEMHHRTKNNLQIVSSLLSLQAAQYKDPALRQGFNETVARIRAMAHLHEQLYQGGDIAAVDCGAYLATISRSLIGEGRATDRVTLVIDVDPLVMAMDRAVPLALIANELLTNALKHGLPGERQGHILVGLKREGGEIVLTISDDGIGFAEGTRPERSGSLGMQLIRGLTSQLKGSVTMDGKPGRGTVTTVRFPDRER